jgi:acyl-homoserine lactone acylase PvdQ
MVTLLITSFFLLAGITYAIYLWQRPSSSEEAEFTFPPPRATGLFDESGLNEPSPRGLPSSGVFTEQERTALLARASEGDKQVLRDASATRDPALYDEVLNRLVERADSDKSLLALASYITRSDANLRINSRLAERFIESWKSAPDRNSTARMLHVAALSGDAALYQRAIETVYQFWRDRRLTAISADELRQLIESEFWLLAPSVRNSGAGFLLKRKLAQLRRQLVAASKTVTSDE